MDTKKLDTCSKDVISWLPEEVLGKILSSIPTKQAASTSVLSKKWRNVFALVHNLDFDDSASMYQEEDEEERDGASFRNFVDRTLALQCGSPIKKFSLKRYCNGDNELADVYRWICNAVERGVLEVDVSLKTEFLIYLPSELFNCKTLVKLSLGTRVSFGNLPPDVSLPALKTLFIDSIFFINEDDLCKVLLPGCPVLEELSIRHKEFVGHPSCISSQTIKKLSIHYDCEFETDFPMSFDTPSLVYLDYSDYAIYDEYTLGNLASLVEARLDIHYSKDIERPDVTDLIKGISNVETLHLSPDSVDVISRCVKHGLLLPVFKNLVSLTFMSKKKRGWKLLKAMLKQSPKLETLIIKGLLNGYTGDVTLRPYKVKVLRVFGYGGTAKELKHLKSFLGETDCLELVEVEIAESVVVDDGIISQTYKDITPLLSTKCKMEVTYFI